MSLDASTWDLLITGGLVFDGHGGTPRKEDVAIAGGRIVARGSLADDPAAATAERVVDASGHPVGLIDHDALRSVPPEAVGETPVSAVTTPAPEGWSTELRPGHEAMDLVVAFQRSRSSIVAGHWLRGTTSSLMAIATPLASGFISRDSSKTLSESDSWALCVAMV